MSQILMYIHWKLAHILNLDPYLKCWGERGVTNQEIKIIELSAAYSCPREQHEVSPLCWTSVLVLFFISDQFRHIEQKLTAFGMKNRSFGNYHLKKALTAIVKNTTLVLSVVSFK